MEHTFTLLSSSLVDRKLRCF